MANSSLYNLLYNKSQSGGTKIKFNFSNFNALLNSKKEFLDKQSSIEGIDGQKQSSRKEAFKISQLLHNP